LRQHVGDHKRRQSGHDGVSPPHHMPAAKADPMELDHRASPGNWASMAVAWNIGRGTGRPISAASGGGAAALGPALAAERSFLALLRTLGARAFRLAGEGPVAAGAARMRLRRRMARP